MLRGLVGYPLGHSYSKIIHQQLVDHPYEMFSLDEEKFNEFMQAKNFEGINVTIPYKEKVMKYLDELDDSAKGIGAVNCVVNKDGRLIGYNTDVYGFMWMLKYRGLEVADKKIAILGSGGASKAVYSALTNLKAKPVVISRSEKLNTISYDELYRTASEFQGIVNTTPVGMYPNSDNTPVDLKPFKNLEMVVDVIANPFRTKLLFNASQKGIKTCGGFEMLVAQAYQAAQIFEGKTIPETKLIECIKTIGLSKQNIVLIGMPSAGKSTIGEALANKLSKELIEMDAIIEGDIKMSIKDYFEKHGEQAFREKEAYFTQYFKSNTNCVISTGGGIVLNESNMETLQENGIIVYLKRDNLVASEDRPLSTDAEAINKLMKQREPLYERYADITVDNNDTVVATVDKIIKQIGEIKL